MIRQLKSDQWVQCCRLKNGARQTTVEERSTGAMLFLIREARKTTAEEWSMGAMLVEKYEDCDTAVAGDVKIALVVIVESLKEQDENRNKAHLVWAV